MLALAIGLRPLQLPQEGNPIHVLSGALQVLR
jgi:hypothetical protein